MTTTAPHVVGRVKWFNERAGYGFIVSDQVSGDILVHHSVLKPWGRRSLLQDATVTCVAEKLERGLQAVRIVAFDESEAKPSPPSERYALADLSGDFERVALKWFDAAKGYGFVIPFEQRSEDVFLHANVVRNAGFNPSTLRDLAGSTFEARIANGSRGLVVTEFRSGTLQ